MNDLHDSDAETLKKFKLTGGQIENITKKYLINRILLFEDLDVQKLSKLCEAEIGFKQDSKKCGF